MMFHDIAAVETNHGLAIINNLVTAVILIHEA